MTSKAKSDVKVLKGQDGARYADAIWHPQPFSHDAAMPPRLLSGK
jgi:hypothetical protein